MFSAILLTSVAFILFPETRSLWKSRLTQIAGFICADTLSAMCAVTRISTPERFDFTPLPTSGT